MQRQVFAAIKRIVITGMYSMYARAGSGRHLTRPSQARERGRLHRHDCLAALSRFRARDGRLNAGPTPDRRRRGQVRIVNIDRCAYPFRARRMTEGGALTPREGAVRIVKHVRMRLPGSGQRVRRIGDLYAAGGGRFASLRSSRSATRFRGMSRQD